jgi:hypothetical protein
MRLIQRFDEIGLTRWRLGAVVVCIGVLTAAVTFGMGSPSTAREAPGVHATSAQTPAGSARTVSLNSSNTGAETDYSGGHLLTADPDGGYWTVGWLGAVTAHGGATSFGSPVISGLRLVQPVVGMAATPDGKGYWLVASDGGIFSYGDAKFYGSAGAIPLKQPVVGMAATPDGTGYWLVASDGGVFTYGDAPYDGSLVGSGDVVVGVLVNATATAYTEVTVNGAALAPSLTALTPAAGGVTAGGQAFGTAAPSLEGETSSVQAAALANMRSIGLSWVRIDANWSWIQYGGPTSFDWSVLDQTVQAIIAAGMQPDLIIDDTPAWARAAGAGSQDVGEPASASAYATFAGEVAARYGPMGVNAYEIWNEPNIVAFWTPAPNPSLYTSMLKDAYASIKAVQPDSTVISGGLAPAADDSAGDIAPVEFLQDMYADGAEGSFDGLGYHAYSYPALPNTFESWSGWDELDQTTPSIRSVMAANGDAGKKVWITEIGAPSAGPNGVGTTDQAAEVTQAVAGAKASPWIAAMFFYTYEDAPIDPDYFGLLNADGSPKPAWAALAAAIS